MNTALVAAAVAALVTLLILTGEGGLRLALRGLRWLRDRTFRDDEDNDEGQAS